MHRSQSGKTDTSEGMVLTPKNVQALRTLFNIAHRLDHKLGSSWVLVLGNLNTLDRILHSPQTTTQVPLWYNLQPCAAACHACYACPSASTSKEQIMQALACLPVCCLEQTLLMAGNGASSVLAFS